MNISLARLFASAALLAIAIPGIGCHRHRHSHSATVHHPGPPPPPPAPRAPFQYPVVRAEGFGVPNPGMSQAQGKLMARRAAEADARRNLLEQVKGAQLSSDTYVRDFVTQYDEINTHVDGLVRGARVVDDGFQPDGSYRVVLEADLGNLSPYIDRYR
jgi:hypothetical protein